MATTRRTDRSPGTRDSACNLVMLRGRCSGDVEIRVLTSGTRLASFGLTVPRTGRAGPATSVPVAVWDPPAWLEELGPAEELIVVGSVRRRFFDAGGGRGSRVEVEAERVARATPAQCERLVTRARRLLDDL